MPVPQVPSPPILSREPDGVKYRSGIFAAIDRAIISLCITIGVNGARVTSEIFWGVEGCVAVHTSRYGGGSGRDDLRSCQYFVNRVIGLRSEMD